MKTTKQFTFVAVTIGLLLGGLGAPAQAQQAEDTPFRAADFEYGDRFRLPAGQQPEIWNPAKRKLLEGGPMVGGTVRATDPRTYCAMAAAGYDFVWVEMQHEAISWEQVARFWRTCPGPAAPGARVAYADEREIQHATDMGAAVIVVPTVDSVEEAQEAVNWTYFPPLGRRSAGGGQGASEIWNDVPGGYRQTWNDNVVLILMIETLEGVENAREIARIPGVTGLFAASGDLGNFSGFGEGDREYEALITEVATAAKEAGIHACAPLRWADRPDFTCFQAGTEAANIRRGAAAELQQAAERYGSTGGGGAGRTPSEAGAVLANLTAECGSITYEDDCYAAVESAGSAAGSLADSDQAQISRRVREIIAANPGQAARIREIAADGGLDVR
ncbi:MAG: aldolase/citrate lyase family protein [Acidobacteria bacterium]|nr:aldolase/citrate lyase family protein [Acidobacteriota bacterium]